jgi:hypothetical protein
MTEKEFDAIGKVMDYFDFGRVHKVMVALDWKWISIDDGMRVPDECEIRMEARRLLTQAAKEKMSIAIGGFYATYRNDGDVEWVDLKFVVENWDEVIEKDLAEEKI